jgi:tetraacyldisaccharide 4'-kinase
MVAWLAEWFIQRGVRVALVSRGYRTQDDASDTGVGNDEARELAQRLPEVPHLQDPDRVAAAQQAIRQHNCQLMVLDDGFQHRRIGRDLDIVLIDALTPFGYGHLLPRGLLREPLHRLARADLIALSRSDTVDEARRRQLRAAVRSHAPTADWIELVHRPAGLLNVQGQSVSVEQLRGRRVAAFAGIGNPRGFYHSLDSIGCALVARRSFPDHCHFDPDELAALQQWVANLSDLDAVVCTCKDLVKMNDTQLSGIPLWALAVDVQVVQGRDVLEHRLSQLLP